MTSDASNHSRMAFTYMEHQAAFCTSRDVFLQDTVISPLQLFHHSLDALAGPVRSVGVYHGSLFILVAK